ncbi:MAG TPA: cation diffusion facilitator family transporter [Gammaproteobacteria bacterium]|nr:cation diffusion facilitator family transporter [Gammaproteobacteria bacterium]
MAHEHHGSHEHQDHDHDHDHDDHGHGHDHSHGHHHGNFSNQKAFLIATGLNLGFVIVEVIYALMANSMSLLADAGHNLGDVVGLVFAWFANYLLTKPASKRYSYGYKKTTVLAAMSNALLLVLATGVIGYESILRLLNPVNIHENIIMIVAGLGILVNGGTALLFIKNAEDDLNIKSAFMHLAGDAVLSLGVVITGAVVLFTHWLWLDPLVGLALAITILFSSWGLMRDSINLIIDAVPKKINQEKVKGYLFKLDGVKAVHDLHIWALSTKETALTAHLVCPERIFSDHDFHEINDYLKKHFQIAHVTLQVERGSLENPCGRVETC